MGIDQAAREDRNKKINSWLEAYRKSPDKVALDGLMEALTPLIKHFAHLFGGGRFDSDLIQAGYEGVLKAVKTYNPAMNSLFVTYAGHYIIGEIRHYIRKEMRFYKPNFLDGLQKKAHGITEDFFEKNGDILSKSELANALNIKEEGIDEVFRAGLVSVESLALDRITHARYETFKLPIEDKITLYEAIRTLTKIKQTVIYSLFFEQRTQQQTADSLGINQRKVSRLLKSSLSDLKEILSE